MIKLLRMMIMMMVMVMMMYHLFPMVNAVINSVTADDRSPC